MVQWKITWKTKGIRILILEIHPFSTEPWLWDEGYISAQIPPIVSQPPNDSSTAPSVSRLRGSQAAWQPRSTEAGGCQAVATLLHQMGPGHQLWRWTAGTYSHHPFGKENDRNQTSRELCSMLFFRGVSRVKELHSQGWKNPVTCW